MKIALLGYGKEGKSTEAYFKKHHSDLECEVLENFTYDEIKTQNFSGYDYVFRSPSVPPLHLTNETSATKYFFDHCPCPIIGVTATKGKQLWDLEKSPHIAVIGQLEPDHLNVHKDYSDYLSAKANITKHQSSEDYLIYFKNNSETTKIAQTSAAKLIAYPFMIPDSVRRAITLPGRHNQDNAIAAIAAVASYYNISPDEYLKDSQETIIQGLGAFHGLPHRLEFLRELNGIKIYDDNFATNPSSTRVAVNAFPNSNLTVITGGRDKTNNEDLPELYEILQAPQVKNVVLMGESGHELASRYRDSRFTLVKSLEEAVSAALEKSKQSASQSSDSILLMSPAAASFDMFQNVYDRGTQFQTLISSL